MSILNTILIGGIAIIGFSAVSGAFKGQTKPLRIPTWGGLGKATRAQGEFQGSPYPETIATMQEKKDAIQTYESTSGIDLDPITERQLYEGYLLGERYEMGMGDPSNP